MTESKAAPEDDFDFARAYGQRVKDLGRFNLAVVGRTGAGKSTLVNAIFGQTVARTGVGLPITDATTYYQHPSGVFGMFDCVGFETGQSDEAMLDQLRELIESRRQSPLEDQVHVAWYVLNAGSARYDLGEQKLVREIADMGLPVVFVVTKTPLIDGMPDEDAVELADCVREHSGAHIFGGAALLTNAKASRLHGPEHGLGELLDATFQAAPQGVRGALDAAQRIDLSRKRANCTKIIAAATAAAAGTAASPIPFSDAALLVPVQGAMMAGIAAQYALPVTPTVVTRLVGVATMATGATTIAGRALANLAKFIPVVGTAAGAAINASIASTLTVAVGWAWVEVCEKLHKMGEKEIEDLLNQTSTIQQIFLAAFRSRLNPPEATAA